MTEGERCPDEARTQPKTARLRHSGPTKGGQKPKISSIFPPIRLDRRWIYYDADFIELPRPILRRAFLSAELAPRENLAIVTLNKGHGRGPGAIVTDTLPDMHLFRGSFGGSVFPLWQYHEGEVLGVERTLNLKPSILNKIREIIGDIDASGLFAYIYSVLYSPRYTNRYRD